MLHINLYVVPNSKWHFCALIWHFEKGVGICRGILKESEPKESVHKGPLHKFISEGYMLWSL